MDRTSFLPAFNLFARAAANSFKAALAAREELSILLAHFAASSAGDRVGLLTQILPLSRGRLEQLILPNRFATGFSSSQEDPFKGHKGESQYLCLGVKLSGGHQWAPRGRKATKKPPKEVNDGAKPQPLKI